ncbi:hypothetical protein PIB30_048556 [Stylosanthes scabra]|uniref:Uncharacterized protein n=1 Tax=Stylosanthes scabra TaxID=79078 RepID=A0ABU6THF4_9FABA|nr:hypothetical protein [Stylosanthes scabra]
MNLSSPSPLREEETKSHVCSKQRNTLRERSELEEGEREGVVGALPQSLFLPCWPSGSARLGSSNEMKNTKLSHLQVRIVVSELSSPPLSSPETTAGPLIVGENIVATGVRCRLISDNWLKDRRVAGAKELTAAGNLQVEVFWKGFQIGLEILKNGSFSEGIDSCLGRIDSHDSELKENVILGPQSRFSHCPNRFRVSQRARALF